MSSPLTSFFQNTGTHTKLKKGVMCSAVFMGVSGCQTLPQDTYIVPPTSGQNTGEHFQDMSFPSLRALTPEEKQLIKDVFNTGNALSDVDLWFHVKDDMEDGVRFHAVYDEQKRIHVYGTENASLNYAQEENIDLFGMFIRTMTGLWQYEAGDNWQHSDNTETTYTIADNARFSQYGPAQQRALMEDYARRFLHPDHETRQFNTEKDCSEDSKLQAVVERQFPSAEKRRKAMPDRHSRSLTSQESALVHALFGDQINSSVIKQHFESIQCDPTAAWVNSNQDITYWGTKHHSADFSTEDDVFKFGIFAHEVTHIWQRHTNYAHTNQTDINEDDKYAYTLDWEKWQFKDYAVEQQGAIIEDYVRTFLHEKEQPRRKLSDDQIALLQKVVETQFPALAQTRTYFKQHGALQGQTSFVHQNNAPRPPHTNAF